MPEFDEAFWEERYRAHSTAHGGRPNPQLVAEVADLAPGTALDAGCGAGADTIWLASRGWRVTAVDIAATALAHARQLAKALDTVTVSRIEWVQADLTTWTPPVESFDVVSAQYVHPAAPHGALFHRLAASVAPGGTLLVVGHHPSDVSTSGLHSPAPESWFMPEEAAAGLDREVWEIVVAEARTRRTAHAEADEITMLDTVLRARKRP